MKQFHEDMVNLRMIFPANPQNYDSRLKQTPLTLKTIIQKQSMLLHGEERRFIRFMPKVIYHALDSLKQLMADKT